MEKIIQLNGVNYYWKKAEFPERYFNDNKQIGLIAQEVEKIIPELVETGADGFKPVDYSKLTPLIVEAIKALKAENDVLKKQIAGFMAEQDGFRAELEAIKAHLGMGSVAKH